MKSKTLILTLLAALAAAPAVYAADPSAPDTSSSAQDMKENAKQTGRDAKDTAKGAAHDTGEYMSDAGITTKVKASLLTEKNLKSLGINVDTANGVVTLTGTVPSSAEIKQAEDVARHVKGVKDVKNDLHLKTDKG